MKFGLVTSQFPGLSTPYNCPFIKDFAHVLSHLGQVELFHLTPFFSQIDRPDHEDFRLHRVKYMSLPEQVWSRWSLSSLRSAFDKASNLVDIDHYILEFMYPAGLLAPMIAEKGIPVSVHIHGMDWFKMWNRRRFRPLIKRALEASTNILVSGEGIANDIKSSLPEFTEKIEVVFNLVDEEIFYPTSDKKKAKSEMEWDQRVSHILCVGHTRRHKRIDLVFEAYLKSDFLREKTHLHYVGDLPDDKYGRKVLDLAQKLPLKCRTLYPPLRKEELPAYYRAADVYVQPSYIEGFGISMIEAAMCGLPVLATPTGIAPFLGKVEAAILMKHEGSDLADLLEQMVYDSRQINESTRDQIKKTFGKKPTLARIRKIFGVLDSASTAE